MIEYRDMVYYLISSLGILVTGVFSYFIVRFTRQTARAAAESAKATRISVELTQQLTKMQEERGRGTALRYAYLLTGEIKHNFRVYKQTDSNDRSLQKLLESDQAPRSYDYTRSSHPIKMTEWDDNKKPIIELDPILGEQLGRVYKRFEILIRHSNVEEIDFSEFTGFSAEVEQLLKAIANEKKDEAVPGTH